MRKACNIRFKRVLDLLYSNDLVCTCIAIYLSRGLPHDAWMCKVAQVKLVQTAGFMKGAFTNRALASLRGSIVHDKTALVNSGLPATWFRQPSVGTTCSCVCSCVGNEPDRQGGPGSHRQKQCAWLILVLGCFSRGAFQF